MHKSGKYAVSVVMAVYKNDKPEWVEQAIGSILGQTLKPDEFIVVVDGPVSKKMINTLMSHESDLNVIQLKENMGLWNALNVGISAARNEYIARMDADDVAVVNRLKVQIDEFKRDRSLAVLGGQIAEFVGTIDNVVSYRYVPCDYKKILQFAKYRSPLNHPTVMYKKSVIDKHGGYSNLTRNEDYELWVRLLMSGEIIKNIDEVLLSYRINANNMSRKVSRAQLVESIRLHYSFYERGFISLFQCILIVIIKVFLLLMPTDLAKYAYKMLRKKELYG